MNPDTDLPAASHFTEISMDSNGYRNPGVRLYHMDPLYLTLLDYDQYYLNMSTLTGQVLRHFVYICTQLIIKKSKRENFAWDSVPLKLSSLFAQTTLVYNVENFLFN